MKYAKIVPDLTLDSRKSTLEAKIAGAICMVGQKYCLLALG
jgi:hypothetical protein